ncbi:GNAT family N-acetyltransferase [Caldibacillus lycopersici]|uniref:GNAT family N-acetyltransferase n=1 Tax=Perspicuibacillus lycopersici TaxID=1325689 RepID=A0AAE3IRS0_9BACI|nr:GNAT family N-acetyltransferase [Perspicuibacillus lycopersici]MCU9613222.1 GNAT family N-acetyltransferase [Perspicuibacillus lycopersici]
MNVTLAPIPYEDKSILFQLIQLYRYDSSEFDGHALTAHGLYSYKYLDHQWTESYRRPLLVKVDGEIAGFALLILDVPKQYTKRSTAEQTNVVSDFFIMRKFRGRGVGKKVAFQLFEQFQGIWEIKQTEGNVAAQIFWEKVISQYPNGEIVEEKLLNNDHWKGKVVVFSC